MVWIHETVLVRFVFLCINLSWNPLFAQDGFNDKTRALYILDISKYVEFDESFEDREEFVNSVLARDDKFYW